MNCMFMSMKNKVKFFLAWMLILVLITPTMVYAQDNIDAYFEDEYEGSSNYYRTETRSKKGLQEAFSYSGTYKDLGISHTLINVCMNQLLNGNVPHVYNGKTYYFNYIPNLSVETVREFNRNDVSVTLVLLMQMDHRSLSHNLIYSGGLSNANKLYYGWNVYDSGAVETLSALMDFLASTYGRENCHIDNWIVGNEVNMPNAWNYTGTTNLNVNVDIAARSFIIVNNAIKRYNSGARAYLSLDHSWMHNDQGRGISGKAFLDAFAARMKELAPNADWHLAYHPYASIMTDSNIWNSRNANKYTTDNINTAFISAKNLNVLTDYVKNTYGEKVRIILSEQGFTTYNGQEAKQAAALAYTYYAAEFNDMIDATMFRSLKDAPEETKDNFYFGLLNSDGSQRMSYNVFKYMDTEQWQTYTSGCLNTIGISLWNEVVTYFDGERFIPKPLEEVILKKDGTVLGVGYSETLEYTVYPEFASTKGLTFISDDESIVKVDANSGQLTAVSPGRTIVMAAYNDMDYATCIVVVKDADESRTNVENFINQLYETVYGKKASGEDLLSYRERLMNRHMTAAEVAHEVISGKEATQPSATDEEYVRLLYKALLGLDDEEIAQEDVEKYVACLQAGMSRDRVFADLISLTEFEYRCYDFDIDAGGINDINKFWNINMQSYNRNSDVTYFVAKTFSIMLGRQPEKEELKGLCSKLLSERVNEGDIIQTIFGSDEFLQKEITNTELVDMLYTVTEVESVNPVVRQIWINLLDNGAVTRENVMKEFIVFMTKEAIA